MNRGDFRNENKFNDMYVRGRENELVPAFRSSTVHPQHNVRIARHAAIIFAKTAGTHSPPIVK